MAKKAKTVRTRKAPKGTVRLPRSVKRMFPNVTECVDSAEDVEISVCKADVTKAEGLNPAECALAKAVKREFHADGAVIGLASSYIVMGNKAIRFATPTSVQREIITFDRHGSFTEGEYYLRPKSPTNKLGQNQHRSGSKRKGSSHEMKHIRMKAGAKVRKLAHGTEY